MYYNRYVDDIFIIYDTSKTNEPYIFREVNNLDPHLQFKLTTETNNAITYMDLTISRRDDNLELSVYRKTIETGTVIHNDSNHPYEQQMAAVTYYINRLLTLPITEASKRSEWTTILAIAINNGYTINTMNNLKKKLQTKQHKPPFKHLKNFKAT